MVHREDGGAAGMSGRGGRGKGVAPGGGRVVRGRGVRRRASKGRLGTLQTQVALRVAGGSPSAGGSIRHLKKTFRTLSFLFRGKD